MFLTSTRLFFFFFMSINIIREKYYQDNIYFAAKIIWINKQLIFIKFKLSKSMRHAPYYVLAYYFLPSFGGCSQAQNVV